MGAVGLLTHLPSALGAGWAAVPQRPLQTRGTAAKVGRKHTRLHTLLRTRRHAPATRSPHTRWPVHKDAFLWAHRRTGCCWCPCLHSGAHTTLATSPTAPPTPVTLPEGFLWTAEPAGHQTGWRSAVPTAGRREPEDTSPAPSPSAGMGRERCLPCSRGARRE